MTLEAAGPKALGMAARGGIHLVAGSIWGHLVGRNEFWVVHAQLCTPNMYGILLGAFADSLRGHLDPIGENCLPRRKNPRLVCNTGSLTVQR